MKEMIGKKDAFWCDSEQWALELTWRQIADCIRLFITVMSCIVLKWQSRSSSSREVIVAKTNFLVTDVGQTFLRICLTRSLNGVRVQIVAISHEDAVKLDT